MREPYPQCHLALSTVGYNGPSARRGERVPRPRLVSQSLLGGVERERAGSRDPELHRRRRLSDLQRQTATLVQRYLARSGWAGDTEHQPRSCWTSLRGTDRVSGLSLRAVASSRGAGGCRKSAASGRGCRFGKESSAAAPVSALHDRSLVCDALRDPVLKTPGAQPCGSG